MTKMLPEKVYFCHHHVNWCKIIEGHDAKIMRLHGCTLDNFNFNERQIHFLSLCFQTNVVSIKKYCITVLAKIWNFIDVAQLSELLHSHLLILLQNLRKEQFKFHSKLFFTLAYPFREKLCLKFFILCFI